MRSSSLFSIAFVAGLATATDQLQERQAPTGTSSLNRTPEGTPIPLEDTIDANCQPTFYIWDRGTLDQQRASGLDRYDSREEMQLSLKDSPFPCERAMYLQASCLPSIWDDEGWDDVSDKGVEGERECFCESEAWDFMEGCRQCNAVHGYGSDSVYIVKRGKEMEWVKQKFCNETVPESNFYWLANGKERFDLFGSGGDDGYRPGEFGDEDETAGKTDVSYYWTASTSRTESGAATASSSETEASETRTLTVATTINAKATDTTSIVSPTSIGGSAIAAETEASAVSSAAGAASSAPAAGAGANEVKVGGGLVLAVLGAMALL